MGIDYCAGYADVIEWETVVELAPQAAVGFLETINKHKGDEDAEYVLAGLANCYRFSEEDPDELRSVLSYVGVADEAAAIDQIKAAYTKLKRAFSEATRVAKTSSKLKLHIGYHDSASQGCRGDELDGVYWYVDGAYELSPAGKKFQCMFERKFFTVWG